MKKLLILLLILSAACLTACGAGYDPSAPQNGNSASTEILVPPFEEGDRELVKFEEISSSRPDTDAIINKSNELSELVKSGSIEYAELVERILEIDSIYTELDTMVSLLMISSSKDLADEASGNEYSLMKSRLPSVERAVEALMVSLARSVWADRLEKEVFGDGFIEEYVGGSRFNDHVTSLLEHEEALKAEYFTLDKVSAKERGADIFIELLKTRRKLAEAYGDDSYADYAYKALGHDYTQKEMELLTRDISEFALPIYTALAQRAFYGYFKTTKAPHAQRADVVNNLYTVFSELDKGLGNAYAYMLNGSLYSVEGSSKGRRDGAFTMYLSGIDAPYVFATFGSSVGDYMTLAHEFGHFYDDFENYGSTTSLDLCEVSSQALELLALTGFKDTLNAREYKYLYYEQMKNVLETLIIQGFYARLEALAYALPYEDINRQTLDGLVIRAAEDMHLSVDAFNNLSDVMIIHLIDTPFYVQSYCTSLIASLDIFFTECAHEGKGVAAYKTLIDREAGEGFTAALKRAKIASPFDQNVVKRLADEIHYSILGSHYYVESGDNSQNAA